MFSKPCLKLQFKWIFLATKSVERGKKQFCKICNTFLKGFFIFEALYLFARIHLTLQIFQNKQRKNPMKGKRTFELKNKYAHSITLQIKYEWANIQHVVARSMSLLLFINELVLISNRFDSPEKKCTHLCYLGFFRTQTVKYLTAVNGTWAVSDSDFKHTTSKWAKL